MGMNLHIIGETAGYEAKTQQTDLYGLIRLLEAYKIAYNNLPIDIIQGNNELDMFTIILATYIEPTNYNNYRKIPVTFSRGGTALEAELIPNAMKQLCENPPENHEHIIYGWVHEFLKIHPFIDGNGRTAWILYNWFQGKMDSPSPLPCFEF